MAPPHEGQGADASSSSVSANRSSKPKQRTKGAKSGNRPSPLAFSSSEGDASGSGQSHAPSGSTTPSSVASEDDSSYPRRIVLERERHPKPPRRGPGFLGLTGKRPPSYTVHAPNTPFDELDLSQVDFLRTPEENRLRRARGVTKYRRSFFLVGILLGAAVAWLAAQSAGFEGHIQSIRAVLDDQLVSLGVDLSQLDFSLRMPKEFAELGDNLFSGPKEWLATKDFRVGRSLAQQGYTAQHPVVLMPGIISTGLESWTTDEDVSGYFRKRLWGTTTMMRTVVLEKDLWIKHLSLDPNTGLDPPGIRVRAAEGMDAASYFVSGYWIWSKIIENLAAIGYDPNTLYMASYDWRLSYGNLEVRDKFFTRLKLRIEQNLVLHGKKTVLVSHSMGSSVALYFMKWVEASGPGFGNGGDRWVETHLESFTSIAGTFLGVPKAMAALLSGEMRDTVEVPPAAAFLLEKFFSRRERARLFRTWAGSASMLIKGGNAVWGNGTWAPDDDANATDTHGSLYTFQPEVGASDAEDSAPGSLDAGNDGNVSGHGTDGNGATDVNLDSASSFSSPSPSLGLQPPANMSADDAMLWLLQHTPSSFQRMVAANYSNGIEYSEAQLALNNQDPRTWSNPLEVALPYAPTMKIIAMYGVGKPTERSYFYKQGPFEGAQSHEEGESGAGDACAAEDADPACANITTPTPPLDLPTFRTHHIDSSVSSSSERASPKVRSGCRMGEGDGTVSLLSLGAMSVRGWFLGRYNPGGSRVVTYEVPHEPEAMDLRGGQTTGDHVDILGAAKVNELVLRIAAGRAEEVEDHFVSQIREYAGRIDWEGSGEGREA